jgi:hypothetical protein
MPSKFRRGVYAFTSNGRRYVVDEVSDGVVYCSADNGAETEFAETSLLTEAEWNARSGGKTGLLYAKLKQSRLFSAVPPKVDRAAAEQVLGKIERLMPGILDFAAYMTAERVLGESGDADQVRELSIAKCREVFDAAKVEVRTGLVAAVLGMQPDILAGAGRMGDNLMRALIAKGMEQQAPAFEEFSSRRRR